jgi:hypothetical protein
MMDFKDRMNADVNLADSGYEPVVTSHVHSSDHSTSIKARNI